MKLGEYHTRYFQKYQQNIYSVINIELMDNVNEKVPNIKMKYMLSTIYPKIQS